MVTTGAANLLWREKLAVFARSREAILLFGVILPLALALRVISLGKSFDEDEIVSAILARSSVLDFWSRISHHEANSVLYFAIIRLWSHLGQSEFTIRSFSVIVALCTVPVMYSLGTRTFGPRVGSLGALLLAINGFHVEYSQDARGYSLLVFLVTLSSLFFLRSVREGSRKNWICYIVTSTLAIYAHLFAVFVLVAHWVSLLFLPRSQWPLRRLASSTAAIAFLVLPMELFALLRRAPYGEISWIPRTNVRRVYDLFACLAGKPPQVFLPRHAQAILLCAYLIPVVIAVLALAKSRPWSIGDTETWNVAFFLTWLSVPILLGLGISIRKPVFVDRYFITCLPPFILLGSYGFSRFRKAWLAVALLCVIAGVTARGLLTFYESPGQDWRGATQYILSNQKPGDAAVFFPSYYHANIEYYLEREEGKPAGGSTSELVFVKNSTDRPFLPLLQGIPSRCDRVWFIGRDEATETADQQKRSITSFLETVFPGRQEEKRFSDGPIVTLYSK